jgi:hypothetical protein
MTKTSSVSSGALMSPRTAKFVEAMIREGDNFDYYRWLKGARDEQDEAKRLTAASALDEPLAQISGPSDTSNVLRPSPSAVIIGVPVRRAMWRLHQEAGGNGPTRWLKEVINAWHDFQASRARDAVYKYLEAVFAIVDHYRVRRRTNNLLRHAFEFADQPVDKHADPFTAVIRCTCDGQADNKTTSKWARALRYVARSKKPGAPLKAFMKAAGGVNACANRYANHFGRGRG